MSAGDAVAKLSEIGLRQRTRARWAVLALFFTNGALFGNIIPRYPEIKDIFGLSATTYGVTIALYSLGAIISGPFAALLIRRFSSANTATTGTITIGVMLVIAGSAAGWYQSGGGVAAYVVFVVAFFLAGAADSITDVGQNAHALRVQRHYGRSIITSFHAGWSIGAVTGGVMGSLATAAHLPLSVHLGIAAAIFAVVGLVARHFALPGPDDDSALTSIESGASAAGDPEPATPAHRGIVTRGRSVILILAALTMLGCSGTLVEDINSSWSTLYMRDYLGVDASWAGAAFITLLVGQAIGRATGDWLIERAGHRRVLQLGGLLVAAGMGVAVAWPSVPATLAGMALAGLGCATIVPVAMNAANDVPGIPVGTGLTVISWLMRLAFLLSPPLVGVLVDHAGLRAAMVVMPIAGLATVLCARVIAPRERSDRDPSGRAAPSPAPGTR